MTTLPFAITLEVGSSHANRTGSWRVERPVYVDRLPPCNNACPAGENVQEWLYHAESGAYETAWRQLVIDNPFPAIMGRICYHPCETACNRAQVDEAVGINAIERFLGDLAIERGWSLPSPGVDTGKRVLVVGVGPSGLSVAYHLRQRGHHVRLVDASEQLGGMMRYGIPAYRLPRDVLDAEIDRVIDLGIDVECNHTVHDVDQERREGGFDAVYLGVGAQLAKRVAIPSGDSARILDAVSSSAAMVVQLDGSSCTPPSPLTTSDRPAPRPTWNDVMLSLNNVEVVYDSVILVLKGISLTAREGEITTLLGANGAGKTTTLKAISGLLHAERGEVTKGAIELDGERIDRWLPHDIVRRGIVQVFEGRRVFENLTVEENLVVGGHTQRATAAVRRGIDTAFEFFPILQERRAQQAGYLSGGEQQMLAIGRALMSEPKVMLLDEPSLGLAPQIVEDIFRIIVRLKDERQMTVLLVEQNAALALEVADHGYVIENGRIMLQGPAEALRRNPEVKEFYLGLNEVGARRSYRDVRLGRRRRHWAA